MSGSLRPEGLVGMAGLAAVVLSRVGVRIALAVALRRQLIDHPNERSSHDVPTPSGGGIGIAFAVLVTLPVAAGLAGAEGLGWVTVAVALTCLLGVFDDARPLGAGPKMLALALATAPVLVAAHADLILLPYIPTFELGWLSLPLTVFWLTGYPNGFNFMDGINGIAGLTALVSGAAFALAGLAAGDVETALLGSVTAGAALGFLPWNFPRARIFMGDSGSLPLGLLLAATALFAARDTAGPGSHALAFPAAVLLLGPFLLDVTLTLVRRALRGAPLGEAHREHLYQRLSRQWGGHPRVSLLYTGFSVVTAALALGYDAMGDLGRLVSLTLPLLTMLAFAGSVLAGDRHSEDSPREGA